MLDTATENYVQNNFPTDQHAQIEAVRGIIDRAGPEITAEAVAESPPETQKAIAKGDAFSGLPAHDRLNLYYVLIGALGVLALASIIAAVFTSGADTTAFFTFAGLAVGGITGLFVKSPTS